MRKNKVSMQDAEFSILTVDDDEIMTLTLKSYFESAGYKVDIENDPVKAIERIRHGSYDIMLLDFLMRPICGDEVVRQVRMFNTDLFIVLLTGHKSMAPPIKTLRELDIQGYYEKSERFDELELLVESCVKSIRQMKTIKRYRNGLQEILEQIPSLYLCTDISSLLNKVMEQISEVLDCDDGYIYIDSKALLPDEFTERQENYFYAVGECADLTETTAQKVINIEFSDNSLIPLKRADSVYFPLYTEAKQIIGLISLKLERNIGAENIQLIEVYSKQITSVLNNLIFRNLLQTKNKEINNAYNLLRVNVIETINALRLVVDARDIYTRGHSDRVSYYSVLMAKAMNKDDMFIERLRIAGLFHDIGKVAVPDSILLKKDKLSDEEFKIIQKHPSIGKKILSTISQFKDVIDIIEDHHRYYDDSRGYPNERKGLPIAEETKIISIADSFDAMTSRRAYRDALDTDKAISELIRCKGTQFDPDIVDIFVGILKDKDRIFEEIKWTFDPEGINEREEENEKILF
ncbi:HD domain-containing protein [Eubacteriales bacterium OttesenSCG-928-G02]|nr:HD domain-containing protein [Eubacteriales bacterium OttesenSCG-928-G02]